MSKFLTELKKYLIEENIRNASDYYYTFKQYQEQYESLLKDTEEYDFELYPSHLSEHDDYTVAKIGIQFNDYDENDYWSPPLSYTYEIELREEDRMDGYCQCEPHHEGYNPIKRCCGRGCDWYVPLVSITKVESAGHFKFSGYERELWKLREEWDKELGIHQQDKVNEEIIRVDSQIEELLKRKELLHKEIK